MKKFWLGFLLCFALSGFAQTEEAPILTVNTEFHSATIRGAATDAQFNYLLTCGDDKTAKLWTPTGRLVRTFRIPMKVGKEGMLYTCALSPDGRFAAVAGWTNVEFSGYYAIYIFNVSDGKIVQTLGGLDNVVFCLEFSPMGNFLMAGMGGDIGVKAYSTRDWKEVKQTDLATYGGSVNGVDFSEDGRFATISSDGKLKVFDSDFKLVKSRDIPGEYSPMNVNFSPDGKYLATSYDDGWKVEVYDAKTLKPAYDPDVRGGEENSRWSHMSNAVFSNDGQYLYGGGYKKMYDKDTWKNVIRVWKKGGKGDYIDVPVGSNTILEMIPFKNGKLFFTTAGPEMGIISPDGNIDMLKESEIKVFATIDKTHFKINGNGKEIGFTPHGKSPLVFGVEDRQVALDEGQYTSLESYTDRTRELEVENWESSKQPSLNNVPLNFMQNGEWSRCVDISNDQKSIVFGSEFEVYCLNKTGEVKWSVKGPTAWAVNISANNKVVAVAYSDGTIRWLRMRDGELLVTLFVYGEDNKWVLFTKDGYYNCSPGAENLIGWHINNGGQKEGEFYPAYQFRSTYYKPEILSKILDYYDIDMALRASYQGSEEVDVAPKVITRSVLPPTVTILSPQEGTRVKGDKVKIQYSVSSPNNERILSVKIKVNGEDVGGFKGIEEAGDDGVEVTLNSGENKISIVAENEHGFSAPAMVNVVKEGVVKDEDIFKPRLYVLAVGVSKYENPSLTLELAAKDARDFSSALQKQKGIFFSDVQVKLLTDGEANKDNILDGLEWLQKQATHRDMVIMYFSGHGVNDPTGNFYYLPVNANLEAMKRTCVQYSEIKTTLTSLPCKVLLFADACHSGNIMGTGRKAAPDITGHLNELASAENGVVVFTSSTGKEFSLENKSWGNGAFTKALIEGILGKADYNQKGSVSIKELDLYVSDRVKEITGGRQHPTAIIPESLPDFPIAIPVNK